ncbi:hypothetical protein SAMN05216368_1157 [Cryobacterium flavum]|uniref:Uncharacterized protein n=1 Tax=Cryobacterium flavum TaxID=1424659 RepID=A0A4R8UYU2_9MICO|nr:hypothetical protein [Cryobacterium flavum]TFB73636.1 hypothetical protein E3O21_17200 [Cryobacterium flavum]SDO31744.1 hypothetical protein SAMN05216368_1157 [Cryobacterium flavum]
MSDEPALSEAAQQFIDDMTAAGAPARADGPRILYSVVPVNGALAGQLVTTGVSISEVLSWPAVPPHWVHLPDTVLFEQTNIDSTDCAPGHVRHSRDYYTDTSIPPARAWLSHVRGFISIAIRGAV